MAQSSTSSRGEFIWHPYSGSALVSKTETVRKLLSWLTCSPIMTFSNILWSLQIRPQLSNVFLIYFFLASDFLQMIILTFYSLCCIVVFHGEGSFVICCWFCGRGVVFICLVFVLFKNTAHLHNSSQDLSFHVYGWSSPTSMSIYTLVAFGMTPWEGFWKPSDTTCTAHAAETRKWVTLLMSLNTAVHLQKKVARIFPVGEENIDYYYSFVLLKVRD